jgi:myo-inositol-1(or 4)-monophosphatase
MSEWLQDRSLRPSLTALVRECARAEILPRFGQTAARAKEDGSLITEADLAMQQRLIEALAQLTPGIPVLGEEMTPQHQQQLLGAETSAASSAATFWALDPLDGTSNYACGFPAFAVSLALFYNGQTVLGLIYDPLRDESFSAEPGQGATLNGARLESRPAPARLADAMALMDFKRIPPARLPQLLHKGAFRSQRNLGSVALDWCWLAAGRAQVYLHGGQRLWDYAAGRLIASEAGVISSLHRQDMSQPLEHTDLQLRLALAASHAELFRQWRAFVALPWQDSSPDFTH